MAAVRKMEAITLPGKKVHHICSSCYLPIMEDEHIQAVDAFWHTKCFRCCMCKKSLSGWYYERDRRLFCRQDYFRKFTQGCHGCAYLITGPVMLAGEHKFHPDCFICVKCKTYIGDGESYALVERSKLYCGNCYQDIVINRHERNPTRRKARHTVQLLTIPPTPEGQKRLSVEIADRLQYPLAPTVTPDLIKKKSLCVVGVEEAEDALDVRLGSRVLEVNGTLVESSNLQELADILRTSRNELRITVEHDPHLSPNDDQSKSPFLPSCNNNDQRYILDSPSKRKRDGMCFSPSDPSVVSVTGPSIHSPDIKLERVGTLPRMKKTLSEENSRMSSFSRSVSVKTQRYQKIFRSSDLIRGEVLGKGFFGQVIKVTHCETGEVMVLKELVKCDERAQKTFMQEAKVLRSLNHKHVLKFIGVVYKDKKLSIITEFLQGGALLTIIVNHNIPLSWAKRVGYAQDISSALEYLHSMKIIHRDLNSQNCLLKEDGSVVVADFGLARITVEDKSHPRIPIIQELTKPGHRKKRYTVVGNPFWMAPEMLKGYLYDEKVDVFSFSIIMCELIGRVDADPDSMPRLSNFGLNINLFRKLYCGHCPEVFYQIAIKCSNLDSDARPSFDVIFKWLTALSLFYEHGAPLSDELKAMNISPVLEDSPNSEAPA